MIMKKRLIYLILPVISVILEMLPYGAVCNFFTPEEGKIRQTFSYFSLTPYGYANFSPLLTAIVTCAVIVALIIFLWNRRVIKGVKILLSVGTVLSLCPLLYGVDSFSVVGALISLSLIAELVLITLGEKTYE